MIVQFKNVWFTAKEECETKKPFEIMLHVGRVTSLLSWVAKNHVTVRPLQINVLFLTTLPTLKACNSPYMQYYFKRLFVLRSYIFISDQKVKAKSSGNRNCIFSSPWESQGSHIELLYISAITSPTN